MNHKPLPASLDLGQTLARRLHQLMLHRNLTISDLANRSRFSVQRLQDLEAGLETWLSAVDRQALAKALAVEPSLLQEVEVRAVKTDSAASKMLDKKSIEDLTTAILEGERGLPCPDCGMPLKCTVQEGFDIEENRIYIPRAFCLKCPFVLRG